MEQREEQIGGSELELPPTKTETPEKIKPSSLDESIYAGMDQDEQRLADLILRNEELPDEIIRSRKWIDEIKGMAIEHPPQIQEILRKNKKGQMSSEDREELFRYAKDKLGWFESYSVAKGEPTADTESSKKLAKSENIADSQIQDSQNADEGLESELLKVGGVSQRELRDMDTGITTKGGFKYWIKRLKTDLDVLPEEVKIVVSQAGEDGKMPQGENYRALKNYIERRRGILKFDVLKRKRMALLKDSLKKIDSGENPFGRRPDSKRTSIYYDEAGETFYIEKDGHNIPISIGDVVADYGWDLTYAPDDSMPRHVVRKLSKRIAINEARRDIEGIYDSELRTVHGVSGGVNSGLTIDRLQSMFESSKKPNGFRGTIAERAIQEFLTRVSINNPELGFLVERSNAVEDTELKYDFKVKRRERFRGVALHDKESSRDQYVKEKRRLGIQFAASESPTYLRHKTEQIKKAKEKISSPVHFVKRNIEDIVLVAVQLSSFAEYFKRWLEAGKPPGGPEQYMAPEEKRKILKEVSENFIPLTEEQIERAISTN